MGEAEWRFDDEVEFAGESDQEEVGNWLAGAEVGFLFWPMRSSWSSNGRCQWRGKFRNLYP